MCCNAVTPAGIKRKEKTMDNRETIQNILDYIEDNLVKGYDSVAPLSVYEKRALPYVFHSDNLHRLFQSV